MGEAQASDAELVSVWGLNGDMLEPQEGNPSSCVFSTAVSGGCVKKEDSEFIPPIQRIV